MMNTILNVTSYKELWNFVSAREILFDENPALSIPITMRFLHSNLEESVSLSLLEMQPEETLEKKNKREREKRERERRN